MLENLDGADHVEARRLTLELLASKDGNAVSSGFLSDRPLFEPYGDAWVWSRR